MGYGESAARLVRPGQEKVISKILSVMSSCKSIEQLHVADAMLCNAINHRFIGHAVGISLRRILKKRFHEFSYVAAFSRAGASEDAPGLTSCQEQAERPQ